MDFLENEFLLFLPREVPNLGQITRREQLANRKSKSTWIAVPSFEKTNFFSAFRFECLWGTIKL